MNKKSKIKKLKKIENGIKKLCYYLGESKLNND